MSEFVVEFKGKILAEANSEDEAISKAEEELGWSRCKFDITECWQVSETNQQAGEDELLEAELSGELFVRNGEFERMVSG